MPSSILNFLVGRDCSFLIEPESLLLKAVPPFVFENLYMCQTSGVFPLLFVKENCSKGPCPAVSTNGVIATILVSSQ